MDLSEVYMLSKDIEELIIKKINEKKYRGSLKIQVHNIKNDEIKKEMMKIIFMNHPYFGAQIYSTMCYDNEDLPQLIDQWLKEQMMEGYKKEKYANGKHVYKYNIRILLALIILNKFDSFKEYYLSIEKKLGVDSYYYMVNRINNDQLFPIMKNMVEAKTNRGWRIILNQIKSKDVDIPLEWCDSQIEKLLARKDYYKAYSLLMIVKDGDLYHKWANDQRGRDYLDDIVSKDNSENITLDEYTVYLFIKYGYNFYDSNKSEIIEMVLKDELIINERLNTQFYKKFVKNNDLTSEQQVGVLKKMGIDNDRAEEFIKKNLVFSIMYDREMLRLTMFRMWMKDTKKLIDYIRLTAFHEYKYSEGEDRPVDSRNYYQDKRKDMDKRIELFENYLKTENINSPKEVVDIYMNSAFRYLIFFDDMIRYIKNQFPSADLRKLLANYIFWGMIGKSSELSIALHVANVYSTDTWRISKKNLKFLNNGDDIELKKRDKLYFLFSYFDCVYNRINAYYPAMTLEELCEKMKGDLQ